MDSESWLDIGITIVFWLLVFTIAWNENATPPWLYVVLLLFLVYFGLRAIFKKRGMERMVWLYTLNMIVLVYLMYYFSRR